MGRHPVILVTRGQKGGKQRRRVINWEAPSGHTRSMSRGSQGSRSVYVGNIPYTATEEALQDIFRTVGHVVSFRCAGAPPSPDGV